MKVRCLLVAALCAALACEEDPVAPPTGPTAAFEVTPSSGSVHAYRIGDSGALDAVVVRDLFVLPPGTYTARPAGFAFIVPSSRLDSPEALIQALARSYLTRDSALFASLLANEKVGNRKAEYLFFLSDPTTSETSWGYDEEVRIQKRMFHPESPDPGDPIVPADLWMQSLQITLTPLESFGERGDLYSENHGLDGKLDPDIWKASDARYSTYVLFDLTGTDYKVEGEANFVVIEDLTKPVGESGKFLIYIWEDLGSTAPSSAAAVVASATWSGVKILYK